MELKYAGPKPLISQQGVDFKDGKEDKYIYIFPAIEILKALSHQYDKDRVYSYSIDSFEFTEDDINSLISKNNTLKNIINNEIESYKNHLNDEIETLEISHPLLNEDELKVFKNNLKIMKEYRIQRAINKIYYMHIVEEISNLIRNYKIKDVKTPFNEKFWHVLQTIQGKLSEGKNSIKSELKEHSDNTIELKISIY